MRVVVVGASSGLGRCIGVDRGKRGDRVALIARRQQRVEDAAAEAGPGSFAVACDVTDEGSCRAAIAQAAELLDGIDALVYAAGMGVLQPVEQVPAQAWRKVLDTNVVGAAISTSAALPHLLASDGVAAYLSSVSASMGRPWPGFAPYTVSKAALDRLVEAYRVEQPSVRFTRVVVGDCVGGEGDAQSQFPAGWDVNYFGEMRKIWQQRGYMTGSLLDIADLLDGIDFVLRNDALIPSLTLTHYPKR